MTKNLVFFGTPQFAADILEALLAHPPTDVRVVAVVTNSDQKIGRKQHLTPSPVAQIAVKYHLPTFKPQALDAANLAHLKLLHPDLFLVVAFGKIIPPTWLSAPKIKSLNVHFSLLPQYRGALCLQEALKNGDPTTGVTLMEMDDQLDHGPLISTQSISIDQSDNVATLQKKLTHQTIALIRTSLPPYLAGKLKSIPQDESQATYTPSLKTNTRANAFIPWTTITQAINGNQAQSIHHLIRSLNPEPGAWTKIGSQEIKLLSTHLENDRLHLDNVQKPGKTPITWLQLQPSLPLA